LTISYAGDRSSDFQVTFLPIDNGRGLRVTRRITGAEDNPTRPGATRGDFTVPDGTQLVAALNENLSTKQAQEGERFTLHVRSPSRYEGAIIEGHVARVNRSGRVSGRAEMSFEFDRIRLQDGRTSNFAGHIDSVRTTSGETIRVDDEGPGAGRR
jgi:hypothetical protein